MQATSNESLHFVDGVVCTELVKDFQKFNIQDTWKRTNFPRSI